MGNIRGGSTIGGKPILGKEARDNYIGKVVGNSVKESLLYDDGTNVKLNGSGNFFVGASGVWHSGNLTPFSGSYNDLTNKPSTFPPSSHSHSWSQIISKPTIYPAINVGTTTPSDGAETWYKVL